MDSKKLAKIIKLIVEAEMKRQLPKLIQEGVQAEMKKINVEPKPAETDLVAEETDPFSLANAMLDEDRMMSPEVLNGAPAKIIKEKKHYTSNSVLNDILNETKAFNATERGTTDDMDTMSFGTNLAQGGAEALNQVAAGQMGRTVAPVASNTPTTVGLEKRSGLNSNTGLTAFDRIMNRDNSALVKKFKTR